MSVPYPLSVTYPKPISDRNVRPICKNRRGPPFLDVYLYLLSRIDRQNNNLELVFWQPALLRGAHTVGSSSGQTNQSKFVG